MKQYPRELSLRTILLPRDTNANGSVFGGVILSHIDLAGVVPVRKLNPARRFGFAVYADQARRHDLGQGQGLRAGAAPG